MIITWNIKYEKNNIERILKYNEMEKVTSIENKIKQTENNYKVQGVYFK